jgi:hypothetical protein
MPDDNPGHLACMSKRFFHVIPTKTRKSGKRTRKKFGPITEAKPAHQATPVPPR